jgi:hypothetical protein
MLPAPPPKKTTTLNVLLLLQCSRASSAPANQWPYNNKQGNSTTGLFVCSTHSRRLKHTQQLCHSLGAAHGAAYCRKTMYDVSQAVVNY